MQCYINEMRCPRRQKKQQNKSPPNKERFNCLDYRMGLIKKLLLQKIKKNKNICNITKTLFRKETK